MLERAWVRRIVAFVALVPIGASVGCGESVEPATAGGCRPQDDLLLCGQRLNIAHRGGARLAPAETLVAFQNATDIGVDVLEMDVHRTIDGAVVVLHDDTVDSTTNGSGQVKSMTLDEVKQLDAAYNFTMDGTTYPYRGQGITIPTLDEVMSAFPDAWYSVEIKQQDPPMVDDTLAVLARHGTAPRTVIASFRDEVLTELRAKAPGQKTSLSLGEMLELYSVTDDTEADYTAPAPIIQAPDNVIEPDLVDRAHRLGLSVEVWTVNDRTRMETLFDLGVDGIITDDPQTLKDVIASMP